MRLRGARRRSTLVASALLAACGAGDRPRSPAPLPTVVIDGSAPKGASAQQPHTDLESTTRERVPGTPARRKQVAEHLMVVSEHCADPSGKGALTMAPP